MGSVPTVNLEGAEMDDKQAILAALREEFGRWEELLAGMSEEEIIARGLPSDLSVKDVVGHLRAWQQRSIARLEAAVNDEEPSLPDWPEGLDPEADEDLEGINAWIHDTYKDQPWEQVYRDWREGFLRLVELAEGIPEEALFQPGRYRWLGDYRLADVVGGSYEHHEEHLGPPLAWLREHRGELRT
jgi:hypothetical protein